MVTKRLLDLVKEFEGCRLKAYQDPKGIWTIGYGNTGPDVKEGVVWTQEEADSTVAARLAAFATVVASLVKVELNQNQLDALTSFTYNLGVGALKSSHMFIQLNLGHFHEAADEMLKWCHIGSKESSGLLRRRKAERALFLEKV